MKVIRLIPVLVVTGVLVACGSSGSLTKQQGSATTASTTTTADPFAPVTDVSGSTIPAYQTMPRYPGPDFDETTEPDTTTTTEPETTTTEAPPQTYKVGDKLSTTDGVSVQVFSYTQPAYSTNEYSKPGQGLQFGLVDVEVCASSTTGISYNDLALKAKMADNRDYETGFSNAKEPSLGADDIAVGGGCHRGYITLEVPTGQRPVKLVWDYGDVHGEWAV